MARRPRRWKQLSSGGFQVIYTDGGHWSKELSFNQHAHSAYSWFYADHSDHVSTLLLMFQAPQEHGGLR